jgi:hypothetical protein
MTYAFDVIAWLAAAKYIKMRIVPPSQQRLWWTLLTACTSINIHLIVQRKIWSVQPSIIILLLILLAMYYSQQLTRNDDPQEGHKGKQLRQVFFVNYYKFWDIVMLNTLLVLMKWVVRPTLKMPGPITGKNGLL